ncbi:MAG: flagellar assembly protein FliW [Eubacteriales bacterium]
MSSESKQIFFPIGIPGFENLNNFLLIEEDTNLSRLNSLDNAEVGFIVLRPQMYFAEYLTQVDINPDEAELIDLEAGDKVDVWVILTFCLQDVSKSTVNLKAPLIVNPRTGKGIQLILDNDKYSSRQLLLGNSSNGKETSQKGAVG